MIVVLTYHKILASAGEGESEFYSISAARFERQMEILKARGWDCITLSELVQAKTALTNKFVLTFDDGTSDHHEVVLPLLKKHGCRGSFYIPTAKLNRPGYLTSAQARELAAAGNEIGSHSHEHQRMDVLSEDEVRQQIAKSQEILAEITGAKPVTFVPPGGFTNECIRRIADGLGMRALRTMRWGHNQKLDLMALETVPVNHYTDEQKFQKLLEPGGAPLLYAGKETLKRIMPLRQYEKLRRLAFKFWKSN